MKQGLETAKVPDLEIINYILLKEQCRQPEGKEEKGVEREEKMMTKSETK